VELLPSVVWTSQSTPAQRIFVHFATLCPCAKTQSVTLTHLFVAQTVTTGEQKISPESDLFKEFLPTPTTPGRTPSGSNYVGLVVVAVFKIGSKYVGITRSLATRRTLGIPKLLKCIDKALSEPCYKKHSSRAGGISFLQELSNLVQNDE